MARRSLAPMLAPPPAFFLVLFLVLSQSFVGWKVVQNIRLLIIIGKLSMTHYNAKTELPRLRKKLTKSFG